MSVPFCTARTASTALLSSAYLRRAVTAPPHSALLWRSASVVQAYTISPFAAILGLRDLLDLNGTRLELGDTGDRVERVVRQDVGRALDVVERHEDHALPD